MGLRVNKVSASSSRSGFAVIVGYYKDSLHRNRRAHAPQKDHFVYTQPQRAACNSRLLCFVEVHYSGALVLLSYFSLLTGAQKMSLKTKTLIATIAAVTLPIVAYLLYDAQTTRKHTIQTHVEALLSLAQVLSFEARSASQSGEIKHLQEALDNLVLNDPSLEALVIKASGEVIAASRPELIGEHYFESQFTPVLKGKLPHSSQLMDHEGIPVLDITTPYRDSNGKIAGVVHLARNLERVEADTIVTRKRHLIVAFAAAGIAGLIMVLLVFFVVIRRLERLRQATLDRTCQPLPPLASLQNPHGDEIDKLSRIVQEALERTCSTAETLQNTLQQRDALLEKVEAFNQTLESRIQSVTTELLETQAQLVHAERIATMGKLSAGMAHQIRNPLFIIQATAERLAKKVPESKDFAIDIRDEVERVNNLITRLLSLSKPTKVVHAPINARDLIERAFAHVARALDETRFQLQLELPEHCTLHGDWPLLRQAFEALFDNALRAMLPKNEANTLLVRAQESAHGWSFEISDQGIGMSPETCEKLLQPFFSKREGGLGLGLMLVQKVIDLHQGSLHFESTVKQGTCVSLSLPMNSAPLKESLP